MFMTLAMLGASATSVTPSASVRTMIRDTREIVSHSGDGIWPDYSRISIPVQLIEPTREVLFCGRPAKGFRRLPIDKMTGCNMQVRNRQLPVDLAAATDLDGQPVIQIGLPDALESSRSEWIVTLLHETFHQYQASLPGYLNAVSAAGRSLGQQGTQWILSYPFPYADPKVAAAFADMNGRALAFLANQRPDQNRELAVAYLAARRSAQTAAGEAAWSYYEFQVGQEGVARWSELKLAQIAGRTDKGVAAVAADRWAALSTSLRAMNDQGLSVWKRGSFYVLGAVEAEMLDRLAPAWQDHYVRRPFSIGDQLNAAVG